MSRLLDILVRELKAWPEGCDELFQTSSGRVIGISESDPDLTEKVGPFTLNDEGTDPHVNRAEFEDARSRIAAPIVEADGMGEAVAIMTHGSEGNCCIWFSRPPDGTLLYASQPAPVSVPYGWRLVPLHPTMDMLDALMEWSKVGNVNAYNNILEAAPDCLDNVKELNQ